ncbi:MarR family winged helix-turn-helix transcriptional regulator [Gordonia neofelifaecis]|uniref:MarR family transcriptional regulator n=1 Tax=Gordonia neofelifaecis NRRL B-59395 TaxID=644548 RepID=F1YK63_9ACTN|nr:MarR family transcriptional regulator [Gordonia neofelifaecis]EGD54909.1 MarR family transcriptional regulator [Gordonia neofelifaecis NRRL B-59395]
MKQGEERDAVDEIVEQWGVERPDMDVSALQVFGRLHRSYLLYQTSLGGLFAEYGLNMASFDVLASLRRAGPPYRMTSGELAKTMLVTTGGVTLRVDRLEKTGLVERKRDPDDRRIVYVCLTTTGLRVIDQAANAHFSNELRLLESLSDEDRNSLSQLLRRLESSILDAESDDEAQPFAG